VTRLAAVTFDAAGTLFDVAEPVGVTYARVATRRGLPLAADDAERRFRDALAAAPSLAFPRVDPTHRRDMERAWWRAIVRATYGEAARAPAFDACFAELFAYYADPAAWQVFGDVRPTLTAIRSRGLRLAVVSNFDDRLLGLITGLGLGALVDAVVPSSLAGAAKPAPQIFRVALGRLGVSPDAAVHVGDGLTADVEGARATGMGAVLLDRRARRPEVSPGVSTITALSELPALLGPELA
jgi:putative hydrolase of the HAD superfamily